ncbi:MAG TPA: TlpA disulfide reductase family protein [Bacteroidaceae bacterium]|nr:TlpA disulfide reductase family protein [Bacteroidaceae bacterium]
MKKNLLFAFVSIALLACSQNKYTVSGIVSGVDEGDTVMICEIVNGNSLFPIDTAIVSNEKYIFKGETDTSEIHILVFYIDDQMATCSFFLEPGNITVNYANGIQTVGGTKTNNSFQKFYDKAEELNQIAMDLEQRLSEASQNNQDLSLLQIEMTTLQDKYKAIVASSIKDNSKNSFGVRQIIDAYSMFEPEELDELLKSLEVKYGDNEYIIQLREMTNQQLNTSTGQQFIDFETETINGEVVKLSDYVKNNKVVLLDFWASWCAPCINEIPYLKQTYDSYKNRGFEIVSVSVDQDLDEWKEAVKNHSLTWPQLIDLQDSELSPAFIYSVRAIPSTFLINGDGEIIARGLRGAQIEEILKELLD